MTGRGNYKILRMQAVIQINIINIFRDMKIREIFRIFSRDSRELRILQWNCNGIRPKATRLREYLELERIDVALIQETHLNPHHTFDLGPDFVVYRKDRKTHKGIAGESFFLLTLYNY